MLQPLSALAREAEGAILRGLAGLLMKRRTANAEMLTISREAVDAFLRKHTVGVTVDEVAGDYVIHVAPKEQERQVIT